MKTHRQLIRNRKYMTVIDFTRPSYEKRLFILDMETVKIEKHLAAHGKNSGKIYARKFSNEFDSFKSSMGFFLTGDKYVGKHGTTLVLRGLEPGLNDNSVQRGIVLHGAAYVSYRSVFLNGGRLGRSEGCPAVPLLEAPAIVEKIQGGSLLYIHAPTS